MEEGHDWKLEMAQTVPAFGINSVPSYPTTSEGTETLTIETLFDKLESVTELVS